MHSHLTLLCSLLLPTAGLAEQHAVDRHIEALGGAQRLAAIDTMHRSGAIAMASPLGETTGIFEEAVSLDADSGYTEIDSETFQSASAWIGETGWKRDSFMGESDSSPEELAFAKILVQPSALAFARSQWGLAAFQEPREADFEGTACTVIQFVNSPLEFYIDNDSHLLIAISLPNVLDVRYTDHREFDGVVLAGKAEVDVPVSATNLQYTFEQTTFGQPIDPNRLGKLSSEPSADQADGEHTEEDPG